MGLLTHVVSFLRTVRSRGLGEAVAEKIRYAGRRSGLVGPAERAAIGAEIAAARAEAAAARAEARSRLERQGEAIRWLVANQAAPLPDEGGSTEPCLVSVVLPVWNRERRIREAIASVRAQTFQNWELLVVDDGSSDRTREVVEEFSRDRRVRLFAEEHRGAAAARNRGLAESRGAIIAYLDSDDVWFPAYLAAIVRAFELDPDREAAYGAVLVSHPDPAETFLRAARFDRTLLLESNFIPMIAFAHRRHLFERLGGFDERLSRLIDWDLILRYTADAAPIEIGVVAGEYRFGPWPRITNEEGLSFNTWKIRRKHPPTPSIRPRVLYALEYAPTLSESYVQAELACMRRWGVEIEIWAERAAPAPYETGLPLHCGELADAIARFAPDVVHTHHLYRGVRHLPAVAAAGVPMTVRAHGFEFNPARIDELRSSKGVDAVYVFPHLVELLGGGDAKIHAMPVAFDPDLHFPSERKDPRLVVRASLAAPAKDLTTFVRLAARNPSHAFVLFVCSSTGYPQHLEEVRALNRSLGEPVDLRVDRPYAEVSAVVRSAGIYLHTTTLEEPYGMPISIAEAMATGGFVIARRCPGSEAYVGDAGAFYDAEDEASALLAETAAWPEERWRRARQTSIDRAFGSFASDVVLRPLLANWARLAEVRRASHTDVTFGRASGGERRTWLAAGDDGAGGLEAMDVVDGRPGDGEAAGSRCASFLNPDGSAQAYFRLARPHPFAGRPVDIEVEVLAEADGDAIHLEYDSNDASVRVTPAVPGAFKATPAQALRRTDEWHRLRFPVDDGRFSPTLNGADFRIVSNRRSGTPLRLRVVELSPRDGSPHTERAPRVRPSLAFVESDAPRVSIIVPTWNRLELVAACLEAVQANTGGDYEVIVVDDGSTDGAAYALAAVRGLRLVALPSNQGFARACNAGAGKARAERLLFLNNDAVPLAGWLEPMLAALDRDPTVGVVGSRLLYPDVDAIQHAGIEFTSTGPRHRLQFFPADAPEAAVDCFVPAVTGACFLVRRAPFTELGGFDEAFSNGCEDVDLCLRMAERGFRVLYCASSIVLHHECATRGVGDADRERANLALLMRRWRAHLDAASSSARPRGS